MKKLSNILDESVWGGMLDRSIGDTIRKEDDVNLLDRDGMVNYIEQNYKIKNPYNLGIFSTKEYYEKKYYENKHYDWVSIPLCSIYGDQNKVAGLVLNFVDDEVIVTTTSYLKWDFEHIKDIYSIFSIEEYAFDYNPAFVPSSPSWPDEMFILSNRSIHMDGHPHCLIIKPKDGDACTNKFYLKVLDYLIDNLEKEVLIQKK